MSEWRIPVISKGRGGAVVNKADVVDADGLGFRQDGVPLLDYLTPADLCDAMEARAQFDLWKAREGMLQAFGAHVFGEWRGAANPYSVKR